MSELSKLTGAGDSTTIAGQTVSPPRLIEIADAEAEAARQYMRTLRSAIAEFSDSERSVAISRATDNLQGSPFTYASPRFNMWALSYSGVIYIGWLSMRITDPRITIARAAELLDSNEARFSVWKAWGFAEEKKAAAVTAGQPTGTASSVSSPDPIPTGTV